ncbi:Uncharacterised protein [uncultured archaeon]|nr:Uncharacterised protein [uncultured archaeon]
MAIYENIRVMISSRCNMEISHQGKKVTLTNVRKELQKEVEDQELFGKRLFEVWISEDEPAPDVSKDVWDKSLQEVKRSHILIVLYSGDAGWAKSDDPIGICHAELEAAMNVSPEKVYFIKLPDSKPANNQEAERNRRFKEFVEKFQPWWKKMPDAETGEDIIMETKLILRQAVAKLSIQGAKQTRKVKFDYGAALDWSRLDFDGRQQHMKGALRDGLKFRKGSVEENNNLFIKAYETFILCICHAIPASMTVAAAREMVGQPFLQDYKFAHQLNEKRVGPVHFIACNRSVTEAQAMRQLGFPDATIVTTPFGVYVADNIQKIQLILIANCRDETTTLYGLQEVFKWLEKSGEGERLAERARARKRIIEAIAKEI